MLHVLGTHCWSIQKERNLIIPTVWLGYDAAHPPQHLHQAQRPPQRKTPISDTNNTVLLNWKSSDLHFSLKDLQTEQQTLEIKQKDPPVPQFWLTDTPLSQKRKRRLSHVSASYFQAAALLQFLAQLLSPIQPTKGSPRVCVASVVCSTATHSRCSSQPAPRLLDSAAVHLPSSFSLFSHSFPSAVTPGCRWVLLSHTSTPSFLQKSRSFRMKLTWHKSTSSAVL